MTFSITPSEQAEPTLTCTERMPVFARGTSLKPCSQVKNDFTFCAPINEFLSTIPKRFASIHIRRGDKVRTTPHDGRFITADELDRLNELTYKAIDYLTSRFDAFFLCGDEDEKIKPFRAYIESKGCSTFGVPAMEKWVSTYYDIAVMTRSEFIVTSSVFQRSASCRRCSGSAHRKPCLKWKREVCIKIDKVIFSTSERFSVFWNLNSRIWKTKLGVEPVCLLFGDRSNTNMSEEFGKIIEVH
jgi:hypothetical protein